MKIGAVIAEYNPIHNGHKYQLDLIKDKYNVDKIIVIMSGDFTQRGEPAILPKELRAKQALLAGADLVLLLPAVYATSGADLFAYGAVSLLDRLNIVDYLFFGSECGDISLLKTIAKTVLANEDLIYEEMKKGITYAKARDTLFPQFSNVISSPNNILGIEYIKTLISLNSSIEPVAICRTDDNYDKDTVTDDRFASARAIRKYAFTGMTDIVSEYVPNFCYEDLTTHKPVSLNAFSDELYYSLLLNKDTLTDYLDISEDLKNRIVSSFSLYESFTEFTNILKSKNFTYARISRGLLHVLLNIKNTNTYYKEITPLLSHIRILGFRKSAKDLLSEAGKKSTITLTSKVPDIYIEASEETKELFDIELFCSLLYSRKSDNNTYEYQRPISIIDL